LVSSRLVVVEGAAGNSELKVGMSQLLAGVPATTVAVFVEREVDQRSAIFKVLKTADKVITFEMLGGSRLTRWVRAEFERLGGSIEPDAVTELIGMAGEDQWRLAGEIAKLVSYSGQATIETVRELVIPTPERTIFEMVEAMTSGRVDAALVAFASLLSQKETEIYILTMIQWQLRNLLMLKLAPAGASPSIVAAEAGMSPYVATKAAAAVGRLGDEALRAAFRAAVDCEADIKSGAIRADTAVEQLIWSVASLVK
jgi:DNA polymerase-3 subunit delta